MLNRRSESSFNSWLLLTKNLCFYYPCLGPDQGGKLFSLPPLNMMLLVSFCSYLLSGCVTSFLFLVCWVYLSWNGFGFCQILFLHLLRCSNAFSPLYSMNVVYYIDSFNILNQPCIPGINSTWLWHIVLFICCWNLFTSILLKISLSLFLKIYIPALYSMI